MGINQHRRTVNPTYKNIKPIIPSLFSVFLASLVLASFVFTVVLLFNPQIVPNLVGEGHFVGAEKVADVTVGEKKWEITLQFIVSVGLVGSIGLLYRSWEARRAKEERQREENREKAKLQVTLLKKFFRSYTQTNYAYKKVRRSFRSRSYCENGNLCIERGDYERLMDELEECQLKIQSLRLQLEVREDDLFGDVEESNSLQQQLWRSEKGLRNILIESEKGFLVRRNMRVAEPIVISRRLREFIEKKSEQNSGEDDSEHSGEDESEQIEQRSNMKLAGKLILKKIGEVSSKGTKEMSSKGAKLTQVTIPP